MAKFNLENYTAADGLGFPLNFRRGNPNPLDNSSVWASLSAAETYAQTDPTAYVGQILSVVDNENNIVTVYSIQDELGTLEKVGTSPIGDEKTITVAEDGTVSLYGIDSITVENKNYQPLLVNGVLTWVEPSATTVEGLDAALKALDARVVAVEGVIGNAESGLAKDVADINTKIGEVTEGKTVVEMITDATYDDSALDGRVKAIEDDYLKSSDKTALETKITEEATKAKEDAVSAILGEAGIDEKYDTLKEVADWILSDTTSSAQLITRVDTIENDYLKNADKTELQDQITEFDVFIGDLPEDATSATLIDYIGERVDGLNIGEYAKTADLTPITDDITALESLVGNTSVATQISTAIEGLNIDQYATDDELSALKALVGETSVASQIESAIKVDGVDKFALAEHAHEATDVTGLTELIADVEALELVGAEKNLINSIKFNGSEVIINDRVAEITYDLPVALSETLGGVKSNEAENGVSVDADGKMSVNSVNVNKLIQTDGEFLILNGGSSSN